MGLFNFTDKPITNSNQTPVKIDPGILTSLNLTQDDVDQNNKESVQKAALEEGASYYKEVASLGDISGSSPVKLGPIALNPNTKDKSDLVDSLKDQIKKMAPAMEPQDVSHIQLYLEGFAKGYVESAFAANDWQTAVKATDATTEGGITKNADVLKKLADTFTQDKETRIQIAQLIQSRINNTHAEPITATPPAPAPPAPEPSKPEPQQQPPETNLTSNPIPQPQTPQPQPTTPIAHIKSPDPITGPGGIILRPVPQQLPQDLTN